jgi:hypothetical protein
MVLHTILFQIAPLRLGASIVKRTCLNVIIVLPKKSQKGIPVDVAILSQVKYFIKKEGK